MIKKFKITTREESGEIIEPNVLIEVFKTLNDSTMSKEYIEYYMSLDTVGAINNLALLEFNNEVLKLVNRLIKIDNHAYADELLFMLGTVKEECYNDNGTIYFNTECLTVSGYFTDEDFQRGIYHIICKSNYKYIDGQLYINLYILKETIEIMFFMPVIESKKPHTYLMTDASGYFKIGKAIDVSKRLKTLATGNPTIKIVHIINENIENTLHKKYATKRVIGEWFVLSKADVEEIKAI